MTKLPVLSGKETIKALSSVGFQPVRQKGDHVILVKMLEIIRQSGMTKEEFVNLLRS